MVTCGAGSVSSMVDADCKCHVMVEDCTVETSQRGDVSLKVRFGILAATDPQQVGKTITEFLQVDGKAVDKLYNVAEAIGLITHDQRRNAAEQGVGLEIDETQFKGKQLCCEIKMEPNMRRNPATGATEVDPEKPGPFPRIGFRTFGIGTKKAEGIPLDQRMLALAGRNPPTAPPAAGVAQPASPPPQGPAASMNW